MKVSSSLIIINLYFCIVEARSKFEVNYDKAFAEKKTRNGMSTDNPFTARA